jgi:hypothetical protein
MGTDKFPFGRIKRSTVSRAIIFATFVLIGRFLKIVESG